MSLVQQISALSPRSSSTVLPFQPAGRGRMSSGVSSKPDTNGTSGSAQQQEQQQQERVRRMDRRTIMILSSSLVASYIQHAPALAAVDDSGPSSAPSSSSRGLARYIRKKKLDPLETYVPMVLEAQQQLATAGDVMAADVQSARTLLRQGAFSGLRDNIRAVGEYAAADGKTKAASTLLPAFFTALNEYDQVLQAALKTDSKLDLVAAKSKFSATVSALDSLLATVPADIMDKSRAILAATTTKSAAGASTLSEDDDRLLRSLLS